MWTMLYLSIGWTWYITWGNDPNRIFGIKVTDVLFIVNLVAMNMWLYLFNCNNNKKYALYTFLVAITTVISLIVYVAKYLKGGKWWNYIILVPYLVWLMFAQQLNFHILESE